MARMRTNRVLDRHPVPAPEPATRRGERRLTLVAGATTQSSSVTRRSAASNSRATNAPMADTVSEAAQVWLDRGRGQKGPWAPSTRERYERIVRRHIDAPSAPTEDPLGELNLADLTVDAVALWSQANEEALAPTTARIALITLNQVCRFALRRGWLAENPVARLEPGEKPRWAPGKVAILEGADLARVLAHGGSYRLLYEMLACTGLRIGELLGLCWADVDLQNGTLHVHRQLSRQRVHRQLKTEAGMREVILAPAFVARLRQHWATSTHKTPDDLVFCTRRGRGLDYRRVGERFRQAVRRSGVCAAGRLSLHSLRHGFASLLIGNNCNPQFVSRQLGHANPGVTLGVYTHLFAKREHGDLARQALDAGYAAMTGACTHEATNEKLSVPVAGHPAD